MNYKTERYNFFNFLCMYIYIILQCRSRPGIYGVRELMAYSTFGFIKIFPLNCRQVSRRNLI